MSRTGAEAGRCETSDSTERPATTNTSSEDNCDNYPGSTTKGKAVEAKAPYLKSWRLAVLMACLFFATFLVAVDTSMITVTVPVITTEFHSLSSVAWVSSAYTLTMTALQPTFGGCYKLFRVEHVYLACIVIFEVGSVVCSTAQSGIAFILGRAIQGFGGAGIFQGSLAIISHTVEQRNRALYTGIITSVFGVAMAFGPILGGAFTNRLNWRWCYWINLPIGAACFAVLLVFLRVTVEDHSLRSLPISKKLMKLDFPGTVVFVGGIVCLLLALQDGGQTYAFNSATIIGLLVGSGCLLVLFGLIQWKRGEEALFPIHVLTQRSILLGACTLFLLGAANTVICFYMPFYFQGVLGVDAIGSGVRFMAYFLPLMLAVGAAGAAVSRWGYYIPHMLAGELVVIIGAAFLIHLEVETPTGHWIAWLIVTGVGMGSAQQLPYTAVQVSLAAKDIPAGNAIMIFAWLVGSAISVAVGQNICLSTLRTLLPQYTTEVSPSVAIAAGAYDLPSLAPSADALAALRAVWDIAITHALLFSLAATCLAVPITGGMEWKNSVKEAKRSESVIDSVDTKTGPHSA